MSIQIAITSATSNGGNTRSLAVSKPLNDMIAAFQRVANLISARARQSPPMSYKNQPIPVADVNAMRDSGIFQFTSNPQLHEDGILDRQTADAVSAFITFVKHRTSNREDIEALNNASREIGNSILNGAAVGPSALAFIASVAMMESFDGETVEMRDLNVSPSSQVYITSAPMAFVRRHPTEMIAASIGVAALIGGAIYLARRD